MNRGKLYGVGVGPGDPELMTRKAERVIREAAVLAVPDRGAGEKTALAIIGPLAEGKERLDCSTPMVRDQSVLDAAYDRAADAVCEKLDQGKDVAFITLGDPTVYSTYLYVHRRVAGRGYETEIVPGCPPSARRRPCWASPCARRTSGCWSSPPPTGRWTTAWRWTPTWCS